MSFSAKTQTAAQSTAMNPETIFPAALGETQNLPVMMLPPALWRMEAPIGQALTANDRVARLRPHLDVGHGLYRPPTSGYAARTVQTPRGLDR